MCSAQRLRWLSSSYSSTLVTKLDGAQGNAGRLVKDETVQSGRCCVMIERVVQSSQRCDPRVEAGLRGVIDPLLSKRESIGRKRGRGGSRWGRRWQSVEAQVRSSSKKQRRRCYAPVQKEWPAVASAEARWRRRQRSDRRMRWPRKRAVAEAAPVGDERVGKMG
ncbi:hypothetical protein GW17_00031985 [Ensete ventricosum]|nr:hypothetical protein GW17_00031985 [Ensete ventricosum]